MKVKTVMGNIGPLGVSAKGKEIQFVFVSKERDCGVILYGIEDGRELSRIPFPADCRVGNVRMMCVSGIETEQFLYTFYEGENEVSDPCARQYANLAYGSAYAGNLRKALYTPQTYDWEGDQNPRIPYEQAFVYCMHVRGFTMDASSQIKQGGTFRAVMEKIPFLEELGVTTLEFQPVYEFDEVSETGKLNYWGYTKGYYYAPKSSYAATGNCVTELKDLVKALHQRGMEAVLQFYFPAEMEQWEVLDVLRFWVKEYHVDGFHIKGYQTPMDLISGDPIFSGIKLWHHAFSQRIREKARTEGERSLGIYGEEFCHIMRKFLKGDEGMMGAAAEQMRSQPEWAGKLNYLTNYEGFTLMDLVSYERKHNEANEENNRDGRDYNYSWNCGTEGSSRKKSVTALRLKQIKNALMLLFCSQGTPLIFMGDEFGNSQGGNNNPYCQDNEITWLNWEQLEKNKEIFDFVRSLARLRREYPILRSRRQLRMMDYLSCGYPDLSYHGISPWQPDMTPFSRQIGIMLCGKYAETDKMEETLFYSGINMYWEAYKMSLPRLPKGQCWEMVVATDAAVETVATVEGQDMILPPRSICLMQNREREEQKKS